MRFGKLFFLLLFSCALAVSAAPSPWDSWRAGYTTYEMAEQWREKGNYIEALSRFRKAKKHYQSVRSARPDWNQRVIAERIAECDRQIAEMEKLLKGGSGVVSPAVVPVSPTVGTAAVSAGKRESATDAAGSYAGEYRDDGQWQALRADRDELRRQVAALKAELIPLKKQENLQRKLEAEIAEMIRDRRITMEKYTLLEARCKELESAVAKPDQERDELQKQLLAERLRAESAEKKAADAEKAKGEAQTRADQNEAAKNAAEKVMRRSQDESRRLTKELDASRSQETEIGRLKQENAKLLSQLESEEKERRNALSLADEKERKLRAELTASEEASAAKVKALQTEIAALNDRIHAETAKAAESTKNLSAKENESEEQTAAFEAQRVRLAADLQNLQHRFQQLLAEKEELSAQLKKQEREAGAAQEKSSRELRDSAARLTAKEKELESLRTTLDSLTALLQKTESQLQKEEAAARVSREDVEKLRVEEERREKELLAVRDKAAACERDLKEYSNRVDLLQKRLEAKESEHFKSAAAANETCRKLEKDLLALQQELAVSRSDLDNTKQQLADRERQLKNARTETTAERTKAIEADEKAKRLAAAAAKAEECEKQLAELRKNFEALSAENRENRLLAAAAKPREAELSSIKLRLIEMDKLKKDLLKEQQLNEELRTSLRKTSGDAAALRDSVKELDAARRRIAQLEAAEQELLRLKELQKQYEKLAGREKEVADLKIQLGENLSRNQELLRAMESRNARIAALEKENIAGKEAEKESGRLKKQLQELRELSDAQSRELASLHEQISSQSTSVEKELSAEQRRELESLRLAAQKLGPLNDEISRLHTAQDLSSRRIEELSSRLRSLESAVELRENEVARLRKLNKELADVRENSAIALREKADEARFSRLASEIQALQKLNASLSAERDRLQRRLEEVEQGIAVPAGSAPAPSASPEELASAGAVAEADGKIESAIWNYQQALQADPRFLSAHERLGKLLFRKERFAEAMPHLSVARAGNPDNLDLALWTASCQIALKRYGNARSVIEPLLQKNPENSRLQLTAGEICAGCGEPTKAEERFITASRLAPQDPEPLLALARLLAPLPERNGEAVVAYEKARDLGASPDPQLEKTLAKILDQRRETVRFFMGAAQEAELSGDWGSALWYYRKLVDIGKEEFVPRVAFAQWKSGKISSARETLEFHSPSPMGMAVLTLIELSENHEDAALLAARRTAGARIGKWVAMLLEYEKLAAQSHPSGAVRMLLVNVKKQ